MLISNRDDDDPKLVCMLRVPHDHCEVVLAAAGVRAVVGLQPAQVGLVWVVGLAACLTLAGWIFKYLSMNHARATMAMIMGVPQHFQRC